MAEQLDSETIRIVYGHFIEEAGGLFQTGDQVDRDDEESGQPHTYVRDLLRSLIGDELGRRTGERVY